MFQSPTKDLLIVLVIVLLIFGPKRLPGLGKQLGTGLREFKDSITGDSTDTESDADRVQRALPRAAAAEARPASLEPVRAPEPAPERRV